MLDSFLKGSKILFLSWPFYQYPKAIENKLEELGASVTTFLSAPTDNFLKIRFLEKFEVLKKRYFQQIIEEIKGNQFDFIFVINAAIFPEYFIKELMGKFVNSKKILYSWDSLAVYPNAINYHKYFDIIFSFDAGDVEEYDYMKFLPLFFCDDLFDKNNGQINNYKYDMSFIGFGHTERYSFIHSVEKQAKRENWNTCFKLYLPSYLHFLRGKYIKGLFKDANRNDFIYKPIPLETIKKITNESRIVVDIELSNQTGLTMRTIETHGMRKKMITTNSQIKNYDFYNEDNILVVDRNNPIIDTSFVEKPYKMLPEDIYIKYSLTNWIKTIFQVTI